MNYSTKLQYILMSIIICVGVIIVVIARSYVDSGPENNRLQDKNFIWPNGCDEKEYISRSRISNFCASDIWIVKHPRRIGLETPGKSSSDYYRVGGDAIYIVCEFYRRDCEALIVKHRVFPI